MVPTYTERKDYDNQSGNVNFLSVGFINCLSPCFLRIPCEIRARVISAILGTLVFIVHFGVLIWFNTEPITISAAGKTVVYAAPIVLSILMIILTLLSQPPKKENEEETEESENDTEETATAETNEGPAAKYSAVPFLFAAISEIFYIYFFKCFFLIFEMLQANIIATTFFLLFK